jgi:hypothetical protein
MFVAKSEALEAIKNILPSPFGERGKVRVNRRFRMLVKSRAVLFVASCMEGRNDQVIARLSLSPRPRCVTRAAGGPRDLSGSDRVAHAHQL